MRIREGTVFVLLAVGLFVGLIALLVGLAMAEERGWARYKIDHGCRVAGHTAGTSTSSGSYVSGQTLYLCDDGQLHGRTE